MRIETMEIVHAGERLAGQAAIPDGAGPHPAVLVMHSAVGLNQFYKDIGPKLAALGYLAICADMYGAEADISSSAGHGAQFLRFQQDGNLLRSRVVAWFDAVRARNDVDAARVAAIGYCFGGQCVLELARSGADAKAVVSYHGVLTTHAPAEAGAVKAHVAFYCGANDPFAPMADITALRKEMEAAGASYAVTVFGDAAHGFTDPHAASFGMEGIEYNAMADKVSWAGTLAILDQVLG
ncbi:MAG TPA: dienelactone hydrolase family protein [Novosphingobium sp.]|nr:dienelactone hydrolase family protein [Novosphingobium sp.]HMP55525.1 dienelactone hydrolase family protein [Novosphingobium sp.]